ncbi:MAG TPA: rhodanese-like domain-containing protein [Phycisphaerae bacterium]|nr:rhodanese-like domain-containing protein [Phycisphaerae bacterium]
MSIKNLFPFHVKKESLTPASTVAPLEVFNLMRAGHSLMIIDVRTPAEFAAVHIAGSHLMPMSSLNLADLAAKRKKSGDPFFIICKSGIFSDKICKNLSQVDGGEVYSIQGGMDAWQREELPVQRGR